MVQYDDTASDEPVRIYDRGMDHGPTSSFGEHQLVYRTGDVVIPRVEPQEPLALELQDFANSIRTGEEPRSNVALGTRRSSPRSRWPRPRCAKTASRSSSPPGSSPPSPERSRASC